jgi:hypothetical protein
VATSMQVRQKCVQDTLLGNICGGTLAANRKRAAALSQVQIEALNDADSFAESEAHTCGTSTAFNLIGNRL